MCFVIGSRSRLKKKKNTTCSYSGRSWTQTWVGRMKAAHTLPTALAELLPNHFKFLVYNYNVDARKQ